MVIRRINFYNPVNFYQMKKIIFVFILSFVLFNSNAKAQRFAYVDTEYILSNIPEYAAAQKELDALAAQWSKDIADKKAEIDKMYSALQAEKVLLTNEMIAQRKAEIKKKEEEVNALQQKRFGFEGDLFKKQQELIKPIQDKVFDAIQKLAKSRSYNFIFDKSGGNGLGMLYADSKYDKSDEIIKNLGYVVKKKKTPKKN